MGSVMVMAFRGIFLIGLQAMHSGEAITQTLQLERFQLLTNLTSQGLVTLPCILVFGQAEIISEYVHGTQELRHTSKPLEIRS